MKYITSKILSFAIVLLGVAALVPAPAMAVNVITDSCKGAGASAKICDADKENIEEDGTVATLINILMFGLGSIAVIAIIVGGIIYATSNGDASKTKRAKDIILYSVVGLIVALMAWGIVSFVLQRF